MHKNKKPHFLIDIPLYYFQISGSHTVVVSSPQSAAVDYSFREEPAVNRARLAINLTDWRNHRVLALRDSRYYYPGVIRNASQNDIYVEFDDGCKSLHYCDVLGARKYDVIGDASPLTDHVTLDAKVCVRIPNDKLGNVFVKGTVCSLLTKPKRFVVRVHREDDQLETHTLTRADLRLIRPPWWDELEEVEDCQERNDVNGKFLSAKLYRVFVFEND